MPIGDDDEGTWLVALGPGDVLPVLGESAPSLLRAARAALGSWAWSDLVVVTDDPGHPACDPLRPPTLFFGDPGSLAPEVARHVAVVTTAPVAASDLTVLVDRQAATLHPVGRVLRPHLQSADTDATARRARRPDRPVGVGARGRIRARAGGRAAGRHGSATVPAAGRRPHPRRRSTCGC